MKNDKIIISGPPSSGKSTIITELKKRKFKCFLEINPNEIKNNKIKNDKYLLSEFLFNHRKKEHDKKTISTSFYDRSMIDVIAYLNYWKITYPIDWNRIIKKSNYTKKIFYTPVWKDIYKKTNTRLESYEESKIIDHFLKKTYLDFKYTLIKVPKVNINERVNFIIENI